MRAKSPRTRPTRQQLNPRLDKMIAAYATAASAVGVAILAAAQPAEAKIVYTKTRKTITTFSLDLNHDGIPDFNIGFCSCVPHGNGVTISSSRNIGNGAIEQPGFPYSAAALPGGAPIGPKQVFGSGYANAGLGMAFIGSYVSGPYSVGPWAGGKNGYLGLRFMIQGQVHFGWARLTITKHIGQVVLTGYAYETIPNKHLRAGQTSDAPLDNSDNAMSVRPAHVPSLGMLAAGAVAIEVWRKKEKEQV